MNAVALDTIPQFSRAWHIANADTLNCPPIGYWVKYFLRNSFCSVDPFARNCRLATWRNDLSPDTAAEWHMDALDFLLMLGRDGVRCDLAIFDPPYSRNQVKDVYQGIGRSYGIKDSQDHTTNWQVERDALDAIMEPSGIVLGMGWNSNGMTLARGYALENVLLVAHGGASNDTICIAERKAATAAEFQFAEAMTSSPPAPRAVSTSASLTAASTQLGGGRGI